MIVRIITSIFSIDGVESLECIAKINAHNKLITSLSVTGFVLLFLLLLSKIIVSSKFKDSGSSQDQSTRDQSTGDQSTKDQSTVGSISPSKDTLKTDIQHHNVGAHPVEHDELIPPPLAPIIPHLHRNRTKSDDSRIAISTLAKFSHNSYSNKLQRATRKLKIRKRIIQIAFAFILIQYPAILAAAISVLRYQYLGVNPLTGE